VRSGVYHRVLSTVHRSARLAARRLLLLLVIAFVPRGPAVIPIDDTIERRWSAMIKARGIYREGGSQVSPSLLPYQHVASVACGTGSKPVRSSHGHFVKVSGLRWLCVMLLALIAWTGGVWVLPFLTVLAPFERAAHRRVRSRRPSHSAMANGISAPSARLCQNSPSTARECPYGKRALHDGPRGRSAGDSCPARLHPGPDGRADRQDPRDDRFL
jgi:hypothetical protein